jgi:Ca2+-binding RTX toxin-like protein
LISISDVDAGSSPVKVTLGGSHGTLTLGSTVGLSFTTGDGSADSTMVFSATIASINMALSGLKFDPDLNYNGSADLSIATNDQGNTGSGGALSDSDPVNITVNAVNDTPRVAVAAGGSCDTSGTKGMINLTLKDVDNPPATPATGLTLSAVSRTQDQALVPNSNLKLGGSGATRTLTVSATPKRSGTAAVTVTVGDGQATSNILITVKVGTDTNETLNGTEGADVIFGKNGNDTINGLGGNDLLCGGNGVGTISGGEGDDTLDGANGNDILKGDAGNDILRGSLGNDTLTGGANADQFSGGAGTDTATDFNAGEGDTKDSSIP